MPECREGARGKIREKGFIQIEIEMTTDNREQAERIVRDWKSVITSPRAYPNIGAYYAGLVNDITSALDEAQLKWQNIETAPKDGCWHPVAHFRNGTMSWWERAYWQSKRSQWRTHGGIVEPTHWISLPDPPEETQ